MAKILFDTSVIIDFLRRKDKEKSILFSLSNGDNDLFVSIVTHTELYAGKSVWESEKAKEELDLLFSGLSIIPLDEKISKEAGKIKADNGINLLDSIIAATSTQNSLKLATLNLKDFEKIKDLRILKE